MPSYAEHAPPPALRRLVACGWTLSATTADADHRVLPDGCMDLVVAGDRTALVAGPSTSAFRSPIPAGGFAAGIRFHPGAAPAILRLDADELVDGSLPLADLWGARSARLAARAPDADGALERLLQVVHARLPQARPPDPVVRAAVGHLTRDPSARIADVAAGVALSERQLHRRCVREIGYGPKRLARVIRLQRLLAAPAGPWAARALAAGYADQPHMARECAALTGLSPTRLAGS